MARAGSTYIHNARVFTAAEDAPADNTVIADGVVWTEGSTVRYAGPAQGAPERPESATALDAQGQFVMPGMTEGHAHLSYANAHPQQLDKQPVPIAMLDALDNARVLLGTGFTSAISFGSAQGIDVPLRDAIAQGRVPGPRLAASDRDIGSTGSNADSTAAGTEGKKLIADGPWAVRSAVRRLSRSRCDIVKIFLDGEAISAHAPPGVLSYTDEEVDAAVTEAHTRGMRVVCHSRSAAAVKQAVRHGVDIIGHANYLDDEAVELLAANRDRIFVGPAIAWEITVLERGHEIGLSRSFLEAQGYQHEVDETISAVKRLRDADVRLLIGGDYGLSITPHGTNAKDLEYYVDLFDMTPVEALLCATRHGGKAYDPSGMVGTLEEGTTADLVLVDGDPTTDVTVLQDQSRLTAVMKDGMLYRGLLEQPYT